MSIYDDFLKAAPTAGAIDEFTTATTGSGKNLTPHEKVLLRVNHSLSISMLLDEGKEHPYKTRIKEIKATKKRKAREEEVKDYEPVLFKLAADEDDIYEISLKYGLRNIEGTFGYDSTNKPVTIFGGIEAAHRTAFLRVLASKVESGELDKRINDTAKLNRAISMIPRVKTKIKEAKEKGDDAKVSELTRQLKVFEDDEAALTPAKVV